MQDTAIMIITDRNKLESWLDQNYWFEDGFISKIEQDSNGLIITVGYQIKGTYVSGEPMTIKEFDLIPKGISNWTFSDSGFKPSYDWCIEGLDLVENDFGIKFETPKIFELTCGSIDFSEPREINTFTKPWISEKEVSKDEETAEQIFEAAIYNWYDEEGNLIYTGKDFTVSSDITTKYKLEVIAEADGFKDYSEVEVKVQPYKLISLTPNPATSQLTLTYDIANSSSAYLIVTGLTNSISNNYILDTQSISTNINLINYQAGHYTVTLVVDGQIIESKNLIKN